MTAPREPWFASLGAALLDAPELPEWLPVKTSDYRLRGLRDRHYAGGVGGRTVGQPGRRIAFVTFEGTAGWVSHWPDPQYVDHAFGDAFVCTLFRKECDGLASLMILDAMRRTEARWGAPPPGGWLTFVDPAEVESPNPGYCFKCAGFAPVGFTKDRGLLVLRRSESEPEPLSEGRANGDSAHPPRRDESGRATTVEMTAASETRPPSESRSGAANSQPVPRP